MHYLDILWVGDGFTIVGPHQSSAGVLTLLLCQILVARPDDAHQVCLLQAKEKQV